MTRLAANEADLMASPINEEEIKESIHKLKKQ